MIPQRLIKKIKNAQLNPGNDKWTYRASGNVLELLVLPQYVQCKKAFRCSVISAGQALASLKTEYNKAGEKLFIQTFPNIENPRVICSIRVDDSGFSETNTAPDPMITEQACNSIEDYLLNTAGNFHMNTHDAYLSDGALKLLYDESQFSHTYVLVSRLDNPFIWLNVGYWKEAVNHYMKHCEPQRHFFLSHFSDSREEFKKHTDLKSGSHLQAVFGY